MMEYLDRIFPTYTISGFRLGFYALVIYLIGYLVGNSGYDAKATKAAEAAKPVPPETHEQSSETTRTDGVERD